MLLECVADPRLQGEGVRSRHEPAGAGHLPQGGQVEGRVSSSCFQSNIERARRMLTAFSPNILPSLNRPGLNAWFLGTVIPTAGQSRPLLGFHF